MAIKRAWIEEDYIACDICGGVCLEVFTIMDRSRVSEGVNSDDLETGIKEAVESYPIGVARYEQTKIH